MYGHLVLFLLVAKLGYWKQAQKFAQKHRIDQQRVLAHSVAE
jgi:hypothetical protein